MFVWLIRILITKEWCMTFFTEDSIIDSVFVWFGCEFVSKRPDLLFLLLSVKKFCRSFWIFTLTSADYEKRLVGFSLMGVGGQGRNLNHFWIFLKGLIILEEQHQTFEAQNVLWFYLMCFIGLYGVLLHTWLFLSA